ncbi:MAG: hypothetical protein ACRDRN_12235 [Sciscionella sp.]
MSAPPPGVVLLCGLCRHVWEPSAQDWATGHTTCPDCGGWVMTAALDEPKATDTSSHAENQQPE